MKLYTDIGKVAKKLLNDDYVFTNKLKISSKTEDGISYTIAGVQNDKVDAFDAELSGKLRHYAATLTGKLFTGSKEPMMEIKYDASDSSDRKVTLSALAARNIATSAVEFSGGPLGIVAAVDFIKSDLYGSAALAVSPANLPGYFLAGAETEYRIENEDVSKANWAISYFDGKESECTVHVLDKARRGMISYSHHVRLGFSVGAQMKYERETRATQLAMGTTYRLDAATIVKAKLDSAGSLALSYIQDIRPNTTLIMSSKFDTKTFDSAKVGISLTVE